MSPSEHPERAREGAAAAIVLAAGQGKRMRSRRPKVLHALLGAPLLRFPLDALDGAGIERKVVVVGVGAEEVAKALAARPGIELASQPEQLGTGHATRIGLDALGPAFENTVLVLPGDAPLLCAETLCALLDLHARERADATVLAAELPDPAGYGRIVRDAEGLVRRVVEERDATPEERAIREVNAGVYAFRAPALRRALGALRPENAQREYYLTDAIAYLVREGGRVAALRAANPDEARGVNDRAELARAAALLAERVRAAHLAAGVTIVAPALSWIEVDVEIGPDTIVEPFTVIRRGARIGAGCHVGPFAHVAEGTVLEDGAEIGNFVEVKRTRVRARAKAKHLAYLGDGDVGAGANIGAGTIFANYDGRAKHPTKVGEGAFIGSGTVLVAPVEVGPGAVTGAGAVVTRGKKVPAGETWAGVPARPLRRKKEAGGEEPESAECGGPRTRGTAQGEEGD